MIRPDIIALFRVPPGERIRLRDYDPGWAQTKELKELGKEVIKKRAKVILEKNLADLAEAQERLWADDRYAVLVVLQAMDAAGKEGTIKHVMSGVQTCSETLSVFIITPAVPRYGLLATTSVTSVGNEADLIQPCTLREIPQLFTSWVTASIESATLAPSTWRRVEEAPVEPTAEFAQLQLGFVDHIQWRYEVIRLLVLFADRTAQHGREKTARTTTGHTRQIQAGRERKRDSNLIETAGIESLDCQNHGGGPLNALAFHPLTSTQPDVTRRWYGRRIVVFCSITAGTPL